MKFKSKIVTLIVVALCFATAVFAEKTLTVLHTNDTHSHLISFSDEKHGNDRGGIVSRAGLIELIKKEGNDPLLLDAGDIWQGSSFFTLFKGEASFKLAKALGYSATTMGNHELDLGIEHLLEMLDKTKINLIACNVAWPDGKKLVFKPYSIFIRNGIKVGVIGRVGFDNWNDCNLKITSKMKLLDDVETVRYYAKKIRPFVDVLLVISHSEIENDRKLAASIAELDAVIGGHTHAVQEAELIKHSENAGDYDNGLGGTIFAEAGEWGHYLGRIDFTVDDLKRITKWEGKLITVLPEHSAYASKEIKDLVEYYDQSRLKQVGKVIGHTKEGVAYDKEKRKEKMLPACILACEALKYASRSNIGMVNARGIRAPIAAGNITVGDAHNMLPYDNTTVVVTLKGSELQTMFDNMASMWKDPEAEAINISGATAELHLKEGKAKNVLVGGMPIDPKKEYRIATTSFMADGNCGGNIYFAKPESMFDTGILMREALIAYVEYLKEISDMDIQTLKLIK